MRPVPGLSAVSEAGGWSCGVPRLTHARALLAFGNGLARSIKFLQAFEAISCRQINLRVLPLVETRPRLGSCARFGRKLHEG